MALQLVEGFDHYAAALTTSKGWQQNPNSMQTGRFGGQCARVSTSGSQLKTLPSTYATLIGGCAVRLPALPTSASSNIIAFYAGVTLVGRLVINPSGQLQVLNAASGVVATGTTVLNLSVWYYVELKIFVNGASGTCEVHLNGLSTTPEIAAGTVGNFGSTNMSVLQIATNGGTGAINNTDIDDVYVVDTSGTVNNTFLGDIRVSTIYPTADGSNSAFTPDTSTVHFSRVNETLADGDTTYVFDNTPGDRDTYAFADIDAGAVVSGIQVVNYIRKDDVILKQVAPVIRQGGVNYDGTAVAIGGTHQFYSQIYDQDPTPANWTPGNVNADEFGLKLVA